MIDLNEFLFHSTIGGSIFYARETKQNTKKIG